MLLKKRSKPAIFILASILIMGLLAPVITNNKPLYVMYRGENLFPVFHMRNAGGNADVYNRLKLYDADWKNLAADRIIFPPFTYSAMEADYVNADYVSPFEKQKFINDHGTAVDMPLRYRHWLGTGKKGEDVLAVLLHGARYTCFIAFASVAIAACIGILLGICSGYFGNYHFKLSWLGAVTFAAGIPLAFFYSYILRKSILAGAFETSLLSGISQVMLSLIIFFTTVTLCGYAGHVLSRYLKLKFQFFIPVDSIISRFIELVISLPALIIIVSLTSLMKPSLLTIILVIGFTGWTIIARLVRAEILKIRNLEYIESARALGYTAFYILMRHALPNISAAIITAVVFTAAAAIMLESSLSFLGIGVPHHIITWGQLLAQSKENFSAWWLSFFPGGLIFITLNCLHVIAKNLRQQS